jgi:hypothetical protein
MPMTKWKVYVGERVANHVQNVFRFDSIRDQNFRTPLSPAVTDLRARPSLAMKNVPRDLIDIY